MKIHFLYGTETGNAEMVCEDIETELGDAFETRVDSLGDVDPNALEADTFYMIVTSTYGNGDLPATAAPFADTLEADKPNLNHVRFAIFGLGDMVFSETFNHGSKGLMEKLLDCGAAMVGERGLYDASTAEMPEDLAIPWAQGILAQLRDKAA